MKIHLILKLVLALCCLYSSPLNAQNSWNLQECIQYALEHNILIKQQKINAEYNENTLNQSRASLYPNLNAGSSYGVSFGRALDQTTYEFTENQTVQSINLNANSSVTLFNGFRQRKSIEQNKFNLLVSLQDLEQLKNDVSLNIAASYLQILLNEELRKVTRDQLEITRQQVERTKALVEAGSLARGNLLEIQSQEAADELSVITAENNLNISYLTLTQLLELDSVGDFSIVIPDKPSVNDAVISLPLEEIYQESMNHLPSIKASEYQLKSSEKGLEIAKGTRSPTLSATASYGSGFSDIRERVTGAETETLQIGQTAGGEPVYTTTTRPTFEIYPFFDQIGDNASTSIFFNLSVPIFNNRQISYNIENARLMVNNSQLELENRKNLLYKDIQQAHADAMAAMKKFRASEKALEAMEENFKYTREKYEVGLVNAVEFNLVQTQLVVTQSDLLQAKYDFIFKTNILNFYRGQPLTIVPSDFNNAEE